MNNEENTIRQALRYGYEQLVALSPTARLDAQLLLCYVLGVEKTYLISHDDRILTQSEVKHYHTLLHRREEGEPIAYILGKQGFYDLEFVVSPDVLIPRPETEHLIEAALEWSQDKPALTAADIGTGSGAIAITFAKHRPQATLHAVDISSGALDVARKNAQNNAVSISFHHGNLAQPLIESGIRLDLLMANLPYIPQADLAHLAVSKYEPKLALDGGEDGLALVRELIQQIPHICKPGALILFEIGSGQGQEVLEYLRMALPGSHAEMIYDYAGHDRIVRIITADEG